MPLNNRGRALKASLYSAFLDFKTTSCIIFSIMFGIIIIQIASAAFINSGITSSNASALNTGLLTALWGIPISLIVMTSNSELFKKFSFPVDRKTLSVSHLIYILLSPLVILLFSCGLYLAEYLLYSVIQTSVPGFLYLWITTKESFITGFCLSYCAIVLLSACTYFLFMYFYRYKIVTSASVLILTVMVSSVPVLRDLVSYVVRNLLFGKNPWNLCVIYLGLSIIFWVLGYFPLKRMEVKK